MKFLFAHIQLHFSKWLSHLKSRTVWIVLVAIALAIALTPLMGKCFGSFFVDMLSPVSLRNIPHKGIGTENNGFASSIAYAIGIILMSGLLIPFVTNYLRTLGNKYANGTLEMYPWKNHFVFLGYDDLMVGTLRRLCQSKIEMGKKKKTATIVVAVPENAAALRHLRARSAAAYRRGHLLLGDTSF